MCGFKIQLHSRERRVRLEASATETSKASDHHAAGRRGCQRRLGLGNQVVLDSASATEAIVVKQDCPKGTIEMAGVGRPV